MLDGLPESTGEQMFIVEQGGRSHHSRCRHPSARAVPAPRRRHVRWLVQSLSSLSIWSAWERLPAFSRQHGVATEFLPTDKSRQALPYRVIEDSEGNPIVVAPTPVHALRTGTWPAVSGTVQRNTVLGVFQDDLGRDIQCRLDHRALDLQTRSGPIAHHKRHNRRERRVQPGERIAEHHAE